MSEPNVLSGIGVKWRTFMQKISNSTDAGIEVRDFCEPSHQETGLNNDGRRKSFADDINRISDNNLTKTDSMPADHGKRTEENESVERKTSLNSALKPACKKNPKQSEGCSILEESVDHSSSNCHTPSNTTVPSRLRADSFINCLTPVFVCLVIWLSITFPVEAPPVNDKRAADCETHLKTTVLIARPDEPFTLIGSSGLSRFEVWKGGTSMGAIGFESANKSMWNAFGLKLNGDGTVPILNPANVTGALFRSVVLTPRGIHAIEDSLMLVVEGEKLPLRELHISGHYMYYLIDSPVLGLQRVDCEQIGETRSEMYSVMNDGFHCNLTLQNISYFHEGIIKFVMNKSDGQECRENVYVIALYQSENHSATSDGKEVSSQIPGPIGKSSESAVDWKSIAVGMIILSAVLLLVVIWQCVHVPKLCNSRQQSLKKDELLSENDSL